TLNVPADGDYKVRVRSATIGDSNTPPSTGFVAPCGITDPVSGPACAIAELTWANTSPALGGQDGAVDDTATDNDAGPGDTWTPLTISGANVTGVDFGLTYQLVTNVNDSGQGSLRQYLLNVNGINAALSLLRNVQFHMQVPANESDGPDTWWRIQLLSQLPPINRTTRVDATTQTVNGGDTNTGEFVHPTFGLAKAVGTGPDGIEGSGDETNLPSYPRPEIEIDGNDQGTIFDVRALNTRIIGFAMYNITAPDHGVVLTSGNSLYVTDNWFGVRANGADPGPGLRLAGGVHVTTGTGILSVVTNNIFGYNDEIPADLDNGTSFRRNEVFAMTSASVVDDGVTAELTTGQSLNFTWNRIHGMQAFCIETFDATGPINFDQNTLIACGQGGGVEAGGIRIFGDSSRASGNVIKDNLGAGISIVQRAGTNAFNDVAANVIYNNTGLAIDIDTTNSGGNPAGDGVTPNDGVLIAADPNDTMDYPVFTQAALSGTNLHVEGYVGTIATKLAGTHDVYVYKALDDGDNNGEIEAGDALSVAHGELRAFLDSCTTAADGSFICDLTVPGAVALAVGDSIVGVARASDDNTSEAGANRLVTLPPGSLEMEKRAFLPDGTPIADGAMLPDGLLIYYMLYINNEAGAFTDISVRDVLDPAFAFQSGTVRIDSSQTACTGPCTPAEEIAVFNAALPTAALTDTIDGDVFSYAPGPATLDFGNQYVANAQLDAPANRVWAAIFQVRTQ
ncbi:MAG: hypothetical protein OEQ74_08190, partial [Gammaproteobacteria bacterium]|nr:hypothetical protein [Gammaproteobacteria bacterium]